MTLQLFTEIHVAISLIGIGTGIVAVVGFLRHQLSRALNVVFLSFTIATSVTGFFFPFHGITPAIIVGSIPLLVLALFF
jgi:hypothetical protein